jgi:hypothetical protein
MTFRAKGDIRLWYSFKVAVPQTDNGLARLVARRRYFKEKRTGDLNVLIAHDNDGATEEGSNGRCRGANRPQTSRFFTHFRTCWPIATN